MNDFDRVLADKGRSDMKRVARHLAKLEPGPDLALVSPSARTRETWSLAALPSVPVRVEETIYEASLRRLVALIQALPDTVALPVLVGHNPSFEDFAAALQGEEPLRKLPTAALVVAEWPAARWCDIRPADGRRVEFLTPSTLGGADSD